ncbi:mobilization protein MobD-like protein [Microcoleus sp. FACHB-1515]|uniref:mobilization protein MobD-like protein n=1 Tax=Cyanophyceae TaxID=3028117 RepID=UPI001684F739|nr:mobilization protein MobD-like protein [Microcoleus sp. FACHB-1515]MBD2091833.1 mobilization protein MobD-like protein [Microcoleus sp. FACHB-1515]
MKLHFINAEKGGVGKSFITSTFVQYLTTKGVLFYLVATDRSNPTSTNRYKDREDSRIVKPRYQKFWDDSVRFVIFSEAEKREDAPDELFELAIERDVVVDLAAQTFRPMSQWITKKNIFQLAKKYKVEFRNWFVCDGEDDSINLFLQSINYYQDKMPHILIRNWGRCSDWEYFEENTELQDAIEQYRVPVIDFPKLSDGKRIKINARRWTFEEALESPEFKIIAKQDIKRFLDEAYTALESSGAL